MRKTTGRCGHVLVFWISQTGRDPQASNESQKRTDEVTQACRSEGSEGKMKESRKSGRVAGRLFLERVTGGRASRGSAGLSGDCQGGGASRVYLPAIRSTMYGVH